MRIVWGAWIASCAMSVAVAAEPVDCNQLQSDADFAACVDARLGEIGAGEAPDATGQPASSKAAQPAEPPLPKPKSPGKWKIRSETSQIDDSRNVYLYLDAEDIVAGGYRGNARPRLYLRCMENQTEAYMDWDPFWFHSDHWVTTRLDKSRAQELEWSGSTDHVAIFHPQPIAFIRSLARADRLVVRAAPINEPNHEVVFDLRGLRYHLQTLQDSCHWG